MTVRHVRPRRWFAAGFTVLLGFSVLSLSPAAQATVPINGKSSAAVTRLPLIGNAGRIPVQLQIVGDDTVGFSVEIPAGAGSWQSARDVAVPALGIHCLGVPGAKLRYACGHANLQASTAPALAPGRYVISLPVSRVGSWAGLAGITSMYQGDPVGQIFSDSFPVADGTTGPRSNAEVRVLTTTPYWNGSPAVGDLAVTVTVVGGEASTMGLDVRMPSGLAWTITRTGGGGKLTCTVLAAVNQSDFVHCVRLLDGVVSPFPTGVFTVVLGLSAVPNDETYYYPPNVAVSYADGTAQLPDVFNWDFS